MDGLAMQACVHVIFLKSRPRPTIAVCMARTMLDWIVDTVIFDSSGWPA